MDASETMFDLYVIAQDNTVGSAKSTPRGQFRERKKKSNFKIYLLEFVYLKMAFICVCWVQNEQQQRDEKKEPATFLII